MNTRQEKIILSFFLTDSYVKLEQLAQLLFLNKRTLNRVMKSVSETLASYHLRIEKRPRYGMKIVGKEIDQCCCFTDMICFYVDNFNIDLLKNGLPELLIDQFELNKVKQICEEYIRKSDLPLSQLSLRKLIIFIIVSQQRATRKYRIDFSEDQKQFLSSIHDDLNLSFLREKLNEFYDTRMSEDDLILIKLIIIINLDYGNLRTREILPEEIKNQCQEKIGEVILELSKYGIVSNKNQRSFSESLTPPVLKMILRAPFHIEENSFFSEFNQAVDTSPLSITIGRLVFQTLQKSFHESFGAACFVEICLSIYSWIRSINNVRKKNVIAIFTPSDYRTGESLKWRILYRFSNVIKRIDILTEKDILTKDVSHYDYFIVFENHFPLEINVSCPIYKVDYYFTENDVRFFFDYVSNPSRIYRRAFGPIHKKDYNVHYHCCSIQTIIKEVRDNTDDSLVIEQLDHFQISKHLIFNYTLNIVLFTKNKSKAFSKLYVLDHYLEYDNKRFNRVFVYVIALDSDMIKIKTSEKVIRNMMTIPDVKVYILSEPFIDFYDYFILLQNNEIS